MHDDYLWDGTGEVDADVAALERVLAPLRYEVEPLVMAPGAVQAPPVRARWVAWGVPAAAMLAALTLVAVMGGRADTPTTDVNPEPVPPAVEPSVAARASTTEPCSTEPQPQLPYDPALARLPGFPAPVDPQSALPPVPRGASGSEAKLVQSPEGRSPTRRAKARTKSGTKARRSDRRAARAAKPEDAPLTVDCVLDPAKCGDVALPRTLSSSDIRAGVASVKVAAAACGTTHSAPEDTKVRVKLAVAGSTGRVLSSTAMPPWNGTPLGMCVAEALEQAQFRRFSKKTLGAVYPIRVDGVKTSPGTGKPADVLRNAGRAISTRVRACGTAHDVEAGARIELSLKIRKDGTAKTVDVVGGEPLSGDATRCVKASIRKLKFGTSPSGVNGRIPVEF